MAANLVINIGSWVGSHNVKGEFIPPKGGERRNAVRRYLLAVLFVVLMATAVALVACGGNSGNGVQQQINDQQVQLNELRQRVDDQDAQIAYLSKRANEFADFKTNVDRALSGRDSEWFDSSRSFDSIVTMASDLLGQGEIDGARWLTMAAIAQLGVVECGSASAEVWDWALPSTLITLVRDKMPEYQFTPVGDGRTRITFTATYPGC